MKSVVKTPSSESARVRAERGAVYGSAKDDFARIAGLWNAILSDRLREDVELNATDVAQMMRMVKESRLVESPDHFDSLLDICGYADLQHEVFYESGPVEPLAHENHTPGDSGLAQVIDAEKIIVGSAVRLRGDISIWIIESRLWAGEEYGVRSQLAGDNGRHDHKCILKHEIVELVA